MLNSRTGRDLAGNAELIPGTGLPGITALTLLQFFTLGE
jgi:hypothetical protein